MFSRKIDVIFQNRMVEVCGQSTGRKCLGVDVLIYPMCKEIAVARNLLLKRRRESLSDLLKSEAEIYTKELAEMDMVMIGDVHL